MAKNRNENWIEYWKAGDGCGEKLALLNIKMFLSSIESFFKFSQEDVVLDVGCGYCFLALQLSGVVDKIYCMDISDNYLRKGKEILSECNNVYFRKINDREYTNFSFLGDQMFSKIICLSVVQYYDSAKKVEMLIKEAKRISKPGGKLIIADIPTSELSYRDALEMLRTAIIGRRFFQGFFNLVKSRFSDYHKIYQKSGLLYFKRVQLDEIVRKMNLKAYIIDEKLTLNTRRLHLIVEF